MSHRDNSTGLSFAFRHILTGRTQSPGPGHDPRSPRGIHRGGGRQPGWHTRIWSEPLTKPCPFGRHSAIMRLTLTEPDVRLLLSPENNGHLRWRILSVAQRLQMQSPCVSILDLTKSLHAWRSVHLQWQLYSTACVYDRRWANRSYLDVCGNGVSVLCTVNVFVTMF